ncbi:hypothetical protein U1Q18_027916 [Sarracenia purpurea var. burkii]
MKISNWGIFQTFPEISIPIALFATLVLSISITSRTLTVSHSASVSLSSLEASTKPYGGEQKEAATPQRFRRSFKLPNHINDYTNGNF